MINYELKLQYCNLVDALHRNITDNFVSVSFDIVKENLIQVQIILKKLSDFDLEYIDDIIAEFSSLQEKDKVLPPIILDKNGSIPLKHIVFHQAQ